MTAAPPVNVATYLADMARQQPATNALLTSPRRDARGNLAYTRTTFRQLDNLSNDLARGLAAVGFAPGDRTAMVLRPGVEFFALTFALFRLGAVPVLIDPGIGLKNFGRCLAQAKPVAFIGIPLAHLLRRLLGWSRNTITRNITTGSFGGISLQKLTRRASPPAADTPSPGNAPPFLPAHHEPPTAPQPAAILFTSGSTGPAKGVLYTHENFDAQIQALQQMYGIQPGEIDLACFPLFALFGPALGMTTVLPDMDFTRPGFVHPPNIIDPIQQLQITNMFGSPALLHRVGAQGERHNTKLPSLKRVISAGAPASAPSLERFSRMLAPDTQIFTPYGATEALPVTSIGSREILAETRRLTDQGRGVCVGMPAPNIRLRIIRIIDAPIPAWSDDLELPPGEIGEIVVQGPVVTSEYFERPEATALAKIRDGSFFYHRMGDAGYLDARGRLWFCGRKSQRVRLPAGDLHSTPVEAIFNTHPSVERSALVAVPRNGGTIPVICVELRKDAPPAQTALVDDLLALAQKHPHTHDIRHFLRHPRFPVDIRHNAKINREQLALWAQRKLQ
jgi:acyl-CoA synthetase (AMP-forming)/AMP-acid ligase II